MVCLSSMACGSSYVTCYLTRGMVAATVTVWLTGLVRGDVRAPGRFGAAPLLRVVHPGKAGGAAGVAPGAEAALDRAGARDLATRRRTPELAGPLDQGREQGAVVLGQRLSGLPLLQAVSGPCQPNPSSRSETRPRFRTDVALGRLGWQRALPRH
jgi:hypothetical protein